MEISDTQQAALSAKPAKKSPLKTVLVIVLAVLLLGGAGVFVWYNYIRDTGEYERYQFDTSAVEGRIQTMTEEEIQAELNRVVEEGMFNISIASAVVIDSVTKEGEARIENIAANHYHMQVDLTLKDTGEKIYSTKLIKPGFSVDTIKLEKDLAPGIYTVLATFSAITQEEMQLFGQAGAEITLYVPDAEGHIPYDLPTPSPSPASGSEQG